LLASKFCEQSNNYGFSFKYTLWDYLKVIQEMPLRKIVNLAKLYGNLFKGGDLSLSVLKIINLEEKPSKPDWLFLNITLDQIFNDSNSFDIIKVTFGKLQREQKISEFREWFSGYIAALYFNYVTKNPSFNQEMHLSLFKKKLKSAMTLLEDTPEM